MPFARLASSMRLTIASLLFSVFAVGGWAQEAPAAPAPQTQPLTAPIPELNYSKAVSHAPNPLAPYTPRHLAPPNFANTARIDTLMHDGKLYLSLNDAIALALENNLDIAIARYNLNIADTDVLRAKAGAPILGVNAGVVQNTPGGGVGGIGATAGASTGGTSLGAGGIGAGTNGLVSSTLGFGPTITSFDPIITGTLQEDHAQTVSSSFFNGVPIIAQNTGTVDFTYNQGFSWGTNLQVGFNNTRATTNVPFTTYSPVINSGLRVQLTQHLLQGMGFPANTRFIRIAKNNRELSDVAFRLQIIDSVDQIENIYWDLVYAYENARVQNESLAFAQKTLSDTKKQVEIGSLAPIETVRAQSTVAQDQQLVTAAQTNLQLEQLLMKNALTRTLKDPQLATSEVIPTSTMDVPAEEQIIPTQDLIDEALRHRAELVESRIDLNTRDMSNKAVRSALLPTLDAFAYYAGSGLGGAQSPANLCVDQSPQQRLLGFCAGPNPDIFFRESRYQLCLLQLGTCTAGVARTVLDGGHPRPVVLQSVWRARSNRSLLVYPPIRVAPHSVGIGRSWSAWRHVARDGTAEAGRRSCRKTTNERDFRTGGDWSCDGRRPSDALRPRGLHLFHAVPGKRIGVCR